jgi:hypothetical protein
MSHHHYSFTDDEIQDTLQRMGLELSDPAYFADLRAGSFHSLFQRNTTKT